MAQQQYQRCNTYIHPIPLEEGEEERPPIPENETEEQRIERYEREGDYITNIVEEPVRREEEIIMFIHRREGNDIVECYTINDMNNLLNMREILRLLHSNIEINRGEYERLFNNGIRTFIVNGENIIPVRDRNRYFLYGEDLPIQNANNEEIAGDNNSLNNAILRGNQRAVDVLLERGLGNNLSLDYAIQQGNRRAVDVLLERGLGNVDVLNNAIRQGNQRIIDVLLERGLGNDNSLHDAIRQGNQRIIDVLLERGLGNDNSLNYAIRQGNQRVIDVLLERGLGNNLSLEYAINRRMNDVAERIQQNIDRRNQ